MKIRTGARQTNHKHKKTNDMKRTIKTKHLVQMMRFSGTDNARLNLIGVNVEYQNGRTIFRSTNGAIAARLTVQSRGGDNEARVFTIPPHLIAAMDAMKRDFSVDCDSVSIVCVSEEICITATSTPCSFPKKFDALFEDEGKMKSGLENAFLNRVFVANTLLAIEELGEPFVGVKVSRNGEKSPVLIRSLTHDKTALLEVLIMPMIP